MTGHHSDIAMIIRYVPHSRSEEYESLGWILREGFHRTHHGEYSVIMEWPLWKGDPVEPTDVVDKQKRRGSDHVSKNKPLSLLQRLFGRWF